MLLLSESGIIRMCYVYNGLGQQFITIHAEHLAHPPIRIQMGSVQRYMTYTNRSQLKRRTESLFGLVQRFCGGDGIGSIVTVADDRLYLIGVEEVSRCPFDPSNLSLLVAYPEVYGDGFARRGKAAM